MKKILLTTLVVSSSFIAGAAFADRVNDWKELEATHMHIVQALHEMEIAQKANHYDMAGHAAAAEKDLRHAEGEVKAAIEAKKHDHDHVHERGHDKK